MAEHGPAAHGEAYGGAGESHEERWRRAVIDPPQPPFPGREVGNERVKPEKGCGEKAWFNVCLHFSKKPKIFSLAIN